MKKYLLGLLIILGMSLNPVFAIVCSAEDMAMCPTSQKVSGPVPATLSKITGMNFLISSVIESQVKKQLDKAMTADFKVNITPYGAKSLMAGKFKKVTAHADSAYLEGFYLSNINAESLCPYNHFVYKGGEVFTNENFLLGYSAEVTSADLQKTIATPVYMKLLNSMSVNVGNISVFKVFDPKAEIKNNRFVFSLKVLSPLTFGAPKTISTDMGLAVSEGRITFTDVRTTPNLASVNLNSILPVINKLNPFVYKASILNNPKSIIKVRDVNFVGNKIVIKGMVIIPKNYYNN